MSTPTLTLLMALWLSGAVNFVSAQQSGLTSSRTAITAHTALSHTGYKGPVELGPLSIANSAGGIEFDKLLAMLGRPAASAGKYDCYHASDGVYLVVERGADDRRLVRGLTLSRTNVCPERKVFHAGGFSKWGTEKGIRLGSSAKSVVSQYGKPTQIDDLHVDSEFYLSPYPLQESSSSPPREGRIFSYLPKAGAPDTSHARFGIRNGVVVWINVSCNE